MTKPATPKAPIQLCSARRRWTEDEARTALDAFGRSGLSMRAFARGAGINAQRLERWRRKMATPVSSSPKVAFVEVRSREAARIEVVLHSGRVLRCAEEISDVTLRRLIGVLEEEPRC